jgi:predicted cation transporter
MLQITSNDLFVVAFIGAVLVVPLSSALIGRLSHLNHKENSFLAGTPQKAIFVVMAALLGLLAYIITPILPLLVLFGVARLLPMEHRMRTSLLLIGCLSIGLGAALTTADLPFSQIAALKLHGSP